MQMVVSPETLLHGLSMRTLKDFLSKPCEGTIGLPQKKCFVPAGTMWQVLLCRWVLGAHETRRQNVDPKFARQHMENLGFEIVMRAHIEIHHSSVPKPPRAFRLGHLHFMLEYSSVRSHLLTLWQIRRVRNVECPEITRRFQRD